MTTTFTDEQIEELLADVRDGTWLDEQEFPPLRWAVPSIVPEGFGLLIGPPKLGKSWFVLGLALSVAAGGKALGKIDVGHPRPVLYMALEDGDRRLQDRARTLLHDESIPPRFQHQTTADPGKVLPIIEAWLTRHGHLQPLILLDTLGKVMPPALPGEGAYQRDYRVGSALKRLADRHPGTTLLVVHHTRKAASEDWMDSTSGTNGLNGSADFTIALTRTRNETDALLKVTGRDVFEAEYSTTTSGGTWELNGNDLAEAADAAKKEKVTVGLGDLSTRVATLVNNSRNGVRAKDVAHALDIEEKDAGTYLLRLERSQRIHRIERGLYGPKLGEIINFPGATDGVGTVGSVGTENDESYTSDTSYTPTPGDGA